MGSHSHRRPPGGNNPPGDTRTCRQARGLRRRGHFIGKARSGCRPQRRDGLGKGDYRPLSKRPTGLAGPLLPRARISRNGAPIERNSLGAGPALLRTLAEGQGEEPVWTLTSLRFPAPTDSARARAASWIASNENIRGTALRQRRHPRPSEQRAIRPIATSGDQTPDEEPSSDVHPEPLFSSTRTRQASAAGAAAPVRSAVLGRVTSAIARGTKPGGTTRPGCSWPRCHGGAPLDQPGC